MSEVIFLLLMPWFFKRLGIKWVLIMGLLAWVIRYGLFALAAPEAVAWMMIAGILVHGACYDFVYVASQVYIDQNVAPAVSCTGTGFFCAGLLWCWPGTGYTRRRFYIQQYYEWRQCHSITMANLLAYPAFICSGCYADVCIWIQGKGRGS